MCVCVCVCVMSCKKETLVDASPTAHQFRTLTQSDYSEFAQRARNSDMGGPSLRTETTYTLSEALELLNHSLNLTYCRPDENHYRYISIVDSVFIPVDGSSLVGEEDLADLFNSIALMAGDFYFAQSDTFKQPFNFEIRAYDNLQTEGLPVEVSFTIGAGQCGSLNAYPYQTTDQWEIYPEGGNCCTSQTSSDALDHWRCDLNANLNYRNKLNPYYYFTDRYSICFDPHTSGCEASELGMFVAPDEYYYDSQMLYPNDPTEEDNYYDYLLFYNTTNYANYHTCLSQDEMNFYYQKQAALSNYYKPSGKEQGKHNIGFNLWASGSNSTVFSLLRVDYYSINEVENESDAETLPCCQ